MWYDKPAATVGSRVDNACDGRRLTDDLGQFITLGVEHDAREAACRAHPSATAQILVRYRCPTHLYVGPLCSRYWWSRLNKPSYGHSNVGHFPLDTSPLGHFSPPVLDTTNIPPSLTVQQHLHSDHSYAIYFLIIFTSFIRCWSKISCKCMISALHNN